MYSPLRLVAPTRDADALLNTAEQTGVRRPKRFTAGRTWQEWQREAAMRRRIERWCRIPDRQLKHNPGIWNIRATPLARRVLYNDMLRDRRVSG